MKCRTNRMVTSPTQLFVLRKNNRLHRQYPIEILVNRIRDKANWQLMKLIKKMDSFYFLILSGCRVFRRRTNTAKLSFSLRRSFSSSALPLTVSFCTHMFITSLHDRSFAYCHNLLSLFATFFLPLINVCTDQHILDFYRECHHFGM